MPWNYRVVKVHEDPEEEPFYEIRLAMYPEGAAPDSLPDSIGSAAIYAAGETVEDIKDELVKMQRALTMPILHDTDYIHRVDIDPQEYE